MTMNRISGFLRVGVVAALLGMLSGCVAHDIGYAEVQRAVTDRTGQRAHWKHVDSSGELERLVQNQLGRTLTADAAAQIALANNPDVQVAFEELGLGRAELVRALRLPNPSAEASLRFGPGESEPELELGVMLDLTDLVTLPWRKKAADSSLEAAQTRLAGELMDIVLTTKRAFFEYQAAVERLDLQRSVVQATKAALTLAEELRAAGNIPELSLRVERARYHESRLELARAKATHDSARERLNRQMGLWGHGTHWRASKLAEPEAAPENLANVEQRALSSSLDLKLSEHEYAAAARRANLESVKGVLPELRAGVAAERQEDEWSVGPAVELELPIFYQGQAEVASAEAQMRREQSRHVAVAVRVRSAVHTAARNLVVSRDSAMFYKDHLLPERRRIVAEAQLLYNAMSIGTFELLQARRDQVRAESAYVDALRDYWIARAEFEQLLTGRLVDVSPLAELAAPLAEGRGGGH